MNSETRRVAVLGGLIDRFGLEGETLGEVAGGAVLKHSHDRDLTRESLLNTRLRPETPAYDVQQACGTGLDGKETDFTVRGRGEKRTNRHLDGRIKRETGKAK